MNKEKLSKLEFIKEKLRINSAINYCISKGDDAINHLITELCELYINNEVTPRSDFKYLEFYKNLMLNNIMENQEEDDKEEEEFKRSDIKKDDQKYIKKICSSPTILKEEKTRLLTNHFGVDSETLSKWIDLLGLSLNPSQFSMAKFHDLGKKKYYLISSAQTASPVHENLLKNMEAYAEHIGAEIGVIATRYRNPTSIWKEEGDVWDKKVHKYLTAKRQDLHPDLVLLADLKIQATSPAPTNGVEVFGGHKSTIVGSPRIEMRSIPVLDSQKQKFIYSTGSVTEPSFTDTVAGGKAAEHHSYGFVIVEIENDDVVHMRSVSAEKDGSFNDLIYRIEDEIVSTEDVDIFVWGDSHFAQKEEKITEAFRGLTNKLGVTTSILHDIWDSEALNVHNIKNPVVQYQLEVENKNNLRDELNQMYEELDWFEENMDSTIVVGSNHDDMLDRAMYLTDWRDVEKKNARLFVDMLALTLSGNAPNGIIPHYINTSYDKVIALGVEDSHIRYGVELAIHGHKGPNGARGNINGFSKLSSKTIIGHSHTPSIKWGCYQVGISCGMKHGYNKGLSGWAYAGCTLNKYGKRQMIILNKETLTYTTLF